MSPNRRGVGLLLAKIYLPPSLLPGISYNEKGEETNYILLPPPSPPPTSKLYNTYYLHLNNKEKGQKHTILPTLHQQMYIRKAGNTSQKCLTALGHVLAATCSLAAGILSTYAVYHPPSGATLLPIAFAMVLGGGLLYLLLCIVDLLIVVRVRGVEWVDECEEGMVGVGEKEVGMGFVRWVE